MSRVTSKGTSKTTSREEVPVMPRAANQPKGNIKMKKSNLAILRDGAMAALKGNTN